ncbi:aminotransferase class I/II-fold pyridoxal phosphate-dependent enzyme [Streptomyces sp. NPDC002742]|uniref:aminotransferase class I/II-fold pyridoxal phosphate-dependent enzyme n=1 Tax=Streptomyces sp. NPDC002742 TaxID=3364663 RepID=UPI00368B9178
MAELFDLGGEWPRWPDAAVRLWRRAMSRAGAATDPSCWVPQEGDPLLREQLASELGVSAGQLVVTSGVRASAAALVRTCSPVLVERPTFLGVPDVLASHGIPVRSSRWEQITEAPRGSALWVTVPCRNPDGRQPDRRFLDDLAAAVDRGVRVICNSAYAWYAGPAELPPGVVRVGTLHKLAGPGAGIGWVIRDDTEAVSWPPPGMPVPPPFWQRTWAHFIEDGGLSLLRAPLRELEAVRSAFLAGAGRPDGGAGPHVLLPVPVPEPYALSALAAVGIVASPGAAFGAGEPAVRVSLIGLTADAARGVGERMRAALS